MNTDIYRVLSCLCSDLGLRLVENVDEPLLQDARNALLLAAESERDGVWGSTETCNLFAKLRLCFKSMDKRYAKPWRPRVFRDLYQALCYVLKVKTEYTPQQQEDYVQRFLQNEKSCRTWRATDFAHSELFRVARFCVSLAERSWDLRPESIAGLCRHGPGAVTQRVRGDDKFVFPSLNNMPRQLTKVFGEGLFYANDRMLLLSKDEKAFYYEPERLSSGATSGLYWEEIPITFPKPVVSDRVVARLSLVPKDWKGPRGVFISPLEAMWVQLGVWETIRRAIPHTWLNACYDPASQVPSQEYCWQASISKCAATLDLSDASDRIPASLVRMLFKPSDWEVFAACRPSAVEMLDGSLRKLYMFAPMGDGKTFPILTIVCAAITVSALLIEDGYHSAKLPTKAVVRRYAGRIRVFGDDIIVPTRYYAAVCTALEACNLKVNVLKSYSRGYFRESCGLDSYKGLDCTPLRLRFQPVRRPSFETVAQAISHHNQVYRQRPDLVSTILYLERYVQRSRWHTGYTRYENVCPGLLACRADEFLDRNLHGRRQFAISLAHGCFEIQVYTRKEVRNLPSLNPWWDFNHWLLTHNEKVDGPASVQRYASIPIEESDNQLIRKDKFGVASSVAGSPTASQQYAELFLGGQWGTASERAGCQLSWVPAL